MNAAQNTTPVELLTSFEEYPSLDSSQPNTGGQQSPYPGRDDLPPLAKSSFDSSQPNTLNSDLVRAEPSTSSLTQCILAADESRRSLFGRSPSGSSTRNGRAVKEKKPQKSRSDLEAGVSTDGTEDDTRNSQSTQTSHRHHKRSSSSSKRSSNTSKKGSADSGVAKSAIAGPKNGGKVKGRVEVPGIVEEESLEDVGTSATPVIEEEKVNTPENLVTTAVQSHPGVFKAPNKLLHSTESFCEDTVRKLRCRMDESCSRLHPKKFSGSMYFPERVGDLQELPEENGLLSVPITVSCWEPAISYQYEAIRQERRERHIRLLSHIHRSPNTSLSKLSASDKDSTESNTSSSKLSSTRVKQKLSRKGKLKGACGHAPRSSASTDKLAVGDGRGGGDGALSGTVHGKANTSNCVPCWASSLVQPSQSVGSRGRTVFWRLLLLVCAHTALWLPMLLLVQVTGESLPHLVRPERIALVLLSWPRPLVGSALLLWFTLHEP